MLSELFYWLFNMSVVATLTGAVVMLLRLIKRIPRRAIAVLWAIPFLRMWIPVGIGGKYGLMSIVSKFTTRTITVYESALFRDFSLTNSVMAADSYFPITYKVDIVGRVFHVSSV
ncbi:MAG: peptidase M56 BlaR1, partial [Clostridia bacterium]|nr:peptidase M56 BlaR1 [Clostridia bacterium]